MKKIKVTAVTCSRSEYGILKAIIYKFNKNKKFNFQLIVGGEHFSKDYGNTIDEIISDKNLVNYKIKYKLKKFNEKKDIIKASAEAIVKFANIFSKIKPDIVILVGDRYEVFAAAFAAFMQLYPIAHIHGGEKTNGSIDDTLRHCITKMSTLHFVATKEYKNRVIQLGENPKNVFNVGALSYETIKKTKLFSKEELSKNLKCKFSKYIFVITIHSITNSKNSDLRTINNLLNSLKAFKDTTFLFTMPNSDSNSKIIYKKIINFTKKRVNAFYFKSMGQINYYSSIKYCNLVIGNSSSGIIEAPYFNKISVNIGERQEGRVKAKSVISCGNSYREILKCLKTSFKKSICKQNSNLFKNPYGKKISSELISNKIENLIINNKIKIKSFYDINIDKL